MQEMWALFAVYQAISRLTGIAADPSVTKVTRTIEFHLLCPWQLT